MRVRVCACASWGRDDEEVGCCGEKGHRIDRQMAGKKIGWFYYEKTPQCVARPVRQTHRAAFLLRWIARSGRKSAAIGKASGLGCKLRFWCFFLLPMTGRSRKVYVPTHGTSGMLTFVTPLRFISVGTEDRRRDSVHGSAHPAIRSGHQSISDQPNHRI